MANLPDITKTSSGIGGQLERFWNGLTGQGAENARTQQTNEYNLASTQATNEANYKIAQETNAMNERVAMQNLGFQRELQEYNKALQERIFEREDTSYQRTAQDMLAAGLNPLSMQGTDGSGEAIAMQPLNNNFQAQQSSPMQAAQMQKPNAMMSPLDAILRTVQASSSVAGSIGQLSNLGVQRDLLKAQVDKQKIENLIQAKKHGINFENGEVSNPYGWDPNQKREYDYKVSSGRYDSDTNPERIVTAVLEALNGRYDQKVQDVKDNVIEKVPAVKEAVEYTKNNAVESAKQTRAEEKGYTLLKGRTTTTTIPHPFKGYNTIKVYNLKGQLVDQYDLDYYGNIIPGGTTVNSSGSSNKSGKF